MNVIICGMPGSGKSHYGALTAKKLNRMLIETDELIVKEYYRLKNQYATCREIVLREGECFFRDLEHQIVRKLEGVSNAIIAVGGGTFCTAENVQMLKKLGTVIYLKVAPQVLLNRLTKRNPLPSYLSSTDIHGSFYSILNQRLPLYEGQCDLSVDVSTENVLEIICKQACKENCHGQ